MTINLTELAAKRAKMTPGDYVVSDQPEFILTSAGGDLICDTYGAPNDIANAAGIVAEHNAIPVLLEVAEAAKLFIACDDDEWEMRYHRLRRQLVEALAKVTL